MHSFTLVCFFTMYVFQNNAQKQTVENAQMLMLGAKLCRLSNDTSLRERVEQTWKVRKDTVVFDSKLPSLN